MGKTECPCLNSPCVYGSHLIEEEEDEDRRHITAYQLTTAVLQGSWRKQAHISGENRQ